MELVRYIVTPPWGGGPWTLSVHSHIPMRYWLVGLLRYIATPLSGSGFWKSCRTPEDNVQWNSCSTPPHCFGALGYGTLAVGCCIALGGVGSVGGFLQRCHGPLPPGQYGGVPKQSVRAAPRQCSGVLIGFHYPVAQHSAAIYRNSSSADCTKVVRRCTAGIPLLTRPGQCGNPLQGFRGPLL